ncbi:MAG: arabinan endo-1,5-alpha-L-arabinosidase, partial [Lachnospiraceae bacterium]
MLTPGFYLNCHNRDLNPLFESHDPSMMWDPISHYYYSYATDAAINSPYKQGIPIRKSKDLVHFTYIGQALSEKAIAEGRNNGNFPPTRGFWAPYCHYYNGEYRLYYSATKAFGSSESRIWLATSDNPEGPFENRGVAMDTWFTSDRYPNAIDPHIIEDKDHRLWLVYGSFFGGIFIKELNPETGLSKSNNPKEFGIRIAKRPAHAHVDGPEGAAVIYADGYYYLFLSYGWLGDDYDIRVGRSKSVTGPYVDIQGKNLDGVSLGMKLAGSYRFDSKKPWAKTTGEAYSKPDWTFGGFRGIGHGIPFYDPMRKEYFFVHHLRDGSETLKHMPRRPHEQVSYLMHYMAVRRMIFLDHWPVFSPELFAGEKFVTLPAEKRSQYNWEWICLTYGNNKQVVSNHKALPKNLIHWIIFRGFDFENSCECICLTGYT